MEDTVKTKTRRPGPPATRTYSLLRQVRLTPYRRDAGPAFALTTWDTGEYYGPGKSRLRYRLTQLRHGQEPPVVISDNDDFGCSPLDPIDSDACLRAILTFLTLRPGDTDREYFDTYTPVQLRFAQEHAEALWAAAETRFGEEV